MGNLSLQFLLLNDRPQKNAARLRLLKRLDKQNVSGARNWARDEFIRELIDEVGP